MGWLDSLKSTVSTALNYVSAPLSQPLTFVTQGPTAAAKAVAASNKAISTGQKSAVGVIATTLVSTAAVGAVILAAAPAAATGAAGTVARSAVLAVVPTTPKAALVTAIAAPVVYGLVKSNPTGAQDVIAKAPSALVNVGENVGTLINEPTLANATNLIKENPVLVGAGAAALIGGAVLAAAPAVSSYLTREEMQKQTEAFDRQATAAEALLNTGGNQTLIAPPTTVQALKESPVGIGGDAPTPETIKLSSKKKRSKRRTAKKTPSITQSLRVNILNAPRVTGMRITNKRYLNQRLLAR